MSISQYKQKMRELEKDNIYDILETLIKAPNIIDVAYEDLNRIINKALNTQLEIIQERIPKRKSPIHIQIGRPDLQVTGWNNYHEEMLKILNS